MSVNEVIREVNRSSLNNFVLGSYKYINRNAEDGEDAFKNNVETYTTEELIDILNGAGVNIPRRGLGPRMYRQILIKKATQMMINQIKIGSYVKVDKEYKGHLRNTMFIQTAESMAIDDI